MEPKADDHRPRWEGLLEQIRRTVGRDGFRDEILLSICRLLRNEIDHYDWAGFYLVDADRKMLRLGPYDGAPTRHLEIPSARASAGWWPRSGGP